jgi:hypothetical protein
MQSKSLAPELDYLVKYGAITALFVPLVKWICKVWTAVCSVGMSRRMRSKSLPFEFDHLGEQSEVNPRTVAGME